MVPEGQSHNGGEGMTTGGAPGQSPNGGKGRATGGAPGGQRHYGGEGMAAGAGKPADHLSIYTQEAEQEGGRK